MSSAQQWDKDGNPLNSLKIDACNLSDEKNKGIHRQGLAQRTDTRGQYKRIGEVYGFPISIISERTLAGGKENKQEQSPQTKQDSKTVTEDSPSTTKSQKSSMVAESVGEYKTSEHSRINIRVCDTVYSRDFRTKRL